MTPKRLKEVPNALNEEYYQIGLDILGSFNKYRPPLNIFCFREDVAHIRPYYKVGERLTNEKIDELHKLTDEGMIFVSRDDHPIYVEHISYQLDLVLVDRNLKEKEIADIFTQALTRRMAEFIEQPVGAVAKKLWTDLMVLTEYLYEDINRSRALVRRMHTEHSLENHSVNCGFLGLALVGKIKGKSFQEAIPRRKFDRLAVGLFLHDIGMSKVAKFVREKTVPLTIEERTKVNNHTKAGLEMITRLDLKYSEVEQCVTQHHERINGSGYPLKSIQQDFTGRLCAVVDSYCAMITKRPNAPAKTMLQAAMEMSKGGLYDMEIVKALQAYLVMDLKIRE